MHDGVTTGDYWRIMKMMMMTMMIDKDTWWQIYMMTMMLLLMQFRHWCMMTMYDTMMFSDKRSTYHIYNDAWWQWCTNHALMIILHAFIEMMCDDSDASRWMHGWQWCMMTMMHFDDNDAWWQWCMMTMVHDVTMHDDNDAWWEWCMHFDNHAWWQWCMWKKSMMHIGTIMQDEKKWCMMTVMHDAIMHDDNDAWWQ
jgi:hypothetical protein